MVCESDCWPWNRWSAVINAGNVYLGFGPTVHSDWWNSVFVTVFVSIVSNWAAALPILLFIAPAGRSWSAPKLVSKIWRLHPQAWWSALGDMLAWSCQRCPVADDFSNTILVIQKNLPRIVLWEVEIGFTLCLIWRYKSRTSLHCNSLICSGLFRMIYSSHGLLCDISEIIAFSVLKTAISP